MPNSLLPSPPPPRALRHRRRDVRDQRTGLGSHPRPLRARSSCTFAVVMVHHPVHRRPCGDSRCLCQVGRLPMAHGFAQRRPPPEPSSAPAPMKHPRPCGWPSVSALMRRALSRERPRLDGPRRRRFPLSCTPRRAAFAAGAASPRRVSVKWRGPSGRVSAVRMRQLVGLVVRSAQQKVHGCQHRGHCPCAHQSRRSRLSKARSIALGSPEARKTES